MVDGYIMSEREPSLGFPEPEISVGGPGLPRLLYTDEGDQSDQRGFGAPNEPYSDPTHGSPAYAFAPSLSATPLTRETSRQSRRIPSVP